MSMLMLSTFALSTGLVKNTLHPRQSCILPPFLATPQECKMVSLLVPLLSWCGILASVMANKLYFVTNSVVTKEE